MVCPICNKGTSQKTGQRRPTHWELERYSIYPDLYQKILNTDTAIFICWHHYAESDLIVSDGVVLGVKKGAVPLEEEVNRPSKIVVIDEDEPKKEEPKEDYESADFFIVQKAQLKILFKFCFDCGGVIRWEPQFTTIGTNLCAKYHCPTCQRYKYWSSQQQIQNTSQYVGNLRVVAAAVTSPIAYPELNDFFSSCGIAGLKKTTYNNISQIFVWPTVRQVFREEELRMFSKLKNDNLPLNISIDGQYDTPGHCAGLCAVACIENSTKQVLTVSCIEKAETGGISNRMELAGVKKCIEKMENFGIHISSITTDRHIQIRSYIQKEKPYIRHYFDAWHVLKSIRNTLKMESKKKCNSELKLIARDFLNHLWYSILTSKNDAQLCKEKIVSSVLHFADVHVWEQGQICSVITNATKSLVNPNQWNIRSVRTNDLPAKFKEAEFSKFLKCEHAEYAKPKKILSPASSSFGIILKIVSSDSLLNDLGYLNAGNATSIVESFNALSIKYRPKKKFFPLSSFEARTFLSALHFNENREAELRGERPIQCCSKVFSKAREGTFNKITKKFVSKTWKRKIVNLSEKSKADTIKDVHDDDVYDEESGSDKNDSDYSDDDSLFDFDL